MEKFDSRTERKKSPYEALKENIRKMALEINADLKESSGIEDFLDESGAVRMDAFGKDGTLDSGAVLSDTEKVRELEIAASAANDEKVREYYRAQYGITTPEGIAARHKEQKERNKSGQMEMLATMLFYKAFGNDFLVARASEFDDYTHGIDNVLINKKTGEIVCAFDEVHDHAQSDRADKKTDKIQKIARRGGTMLKYGLVMESGKFKRASVAHLPVFCVRLATKELEEALQEEKSATAGFSSYEKSLCAKLVGSIAEQAEMLSREKLQKDFFENLVKARNSLEIMRKLLGNDF